MSENYISSDVLMHYGVGKMDGAPGRGSGRYPLGSGDEPYQHGSARDFMERVNQLKDGGLTEKEIAKALFGKYGTTTQLRTYYSLAKDEKRSELVATARRLQDDGLNPTEIARKMGYKNESSVRSLLNDGAETRMNQAKLTAEFLKEVVDKKGMVDVSVGVEKELGNISREKLNQALELLKIEGYEVYPRGVPQVTNPGKQTNINVLCVPGTKYADIYQTDKIGSVMDYEKRLADDGTKIRPSYEYPASMDSKRLMIRYADENGGGGNLKDGVMEIRRGVDDLSLGESHYAQVRILVDKDHYLKGMAVYGDNKDFPDGVDIIFNTNKKSNVDKMDVLKKIGSDPDNPFGALIKEGGQSYYIDKKTGKEKLSLINKTREEGDWGEWSHELPSQFLSKQPKELIKKQLNLAAADKLAEYDEIKSLTNPTVKKRLLAAFADDCDASAEHLKAAALPRQQYQVILPVKSLKDNECFAPNYENGETVALIRFPHGGTFEIPILKVNNKNQEALKYIGNGAKDAVGINKKNADRLSGADFDGDTVMVIPTNSKVKIKNRSPLKDLEGFDPKIDYGPDSTNIPYKRMSKQETQKQMGVVSNLITDMTIKGASEKELARAVKHSMVVIDAEKHNLDYKRSEKVNGIAELKRKYQGRVENGKYTTSASTLISRAKADYSVPKRQGSPKINPDGSLSYKLADDLTYIDKKGREVTRMQRSTQMRETKDARKLSSGTIQEELYASYANQMKSLANQARKEYLNTGKIEYKRSAKETYAKEVEHLNAQLNLALANAPRERKAQLIANSKTDAKVKEYPDLTKKEIKKIKQQELTKARELVGAERKPVNINDREWEAIQSGAISETKLSQILNHTDLDKIRERATPRTATKLSSAKVTKIKTMNASGYTNKEIAKALGVSTSTVSKYL